jgi:hypothetical protein
MKQCLSSVLLAFVIICLLQSTLPAGVPNLVNYQGRATDQYHQPVADGSHLFNFKLYDRFSGGSLLFNETSMVITENGYFNHFIGSVNDLSDDVFSQNDYVYLQITINGETIEPRFRLISSPYAIQAATVEAPLKLESSDTAIIGRHSTGTYGYLGGENYGVYGEVHTFGNYGYLGGAGYGVYGEHQSGNYARIAGPNEAIYAQHFNGNIGRLCGAYEGVYGEHHDGNFGLLGNDSCGVYGEAVDGSYGRLGYDRAEHGGIGVYGRGLDCGGYFETINDDNYALVLDGDLYDPDNEFGGGALAISNGTGIWVEIFHEGEVSKGILVHVTDGMPDESYGLVVMDAGGWAGYFLGDVRVAGILDNSKSGILLDHPVDPENQYLYHSSVNSPDMKNVYDGVVTLDSAGSATVILPDYFETFNTDFRYQLTCIDSYAPIYISKKIGNNRFEISGGKPGMEVSWQVTGIRNDAYAKLNPSLAEREKSEKERGLYLHPEAFGLPIEKHIDYEKFMESEQDHENIINKIK